MPTALYRILNRENQYENKSETLSSKRYSRFQHNNKVLDAVQRCSISSKYHRRGLLGNRCGSTLDLDEVYIHIASFWSLFQHNKLVYTQKIYQLSDNIVPKSDLRPNLTKTSELRCDTLHEDLT